MIVGPSGVGKSSVINALRSAGQSPSVAEEVSSFDPIVSCRPVQRAGSSLGPLIQPFILRVVYGGGLKKGWA